MSSTGVEKRGSASTVRYESRIQQLESLLQDRNATQPQLRQQPLIQDAEPSAPISSWVDSLRHEVEIGPRPQVPDLDPFELDTVMEQNDPGFAEDLNVLCMKETGEDQIVSDSTTVQLPLDRIEPSADFHEDAALLQNEAFNPDSIEDLNLLPPVLSPPSQEIWYLPPPELGTSLLAEFLTDFNIAYPLYEPQTIANHLRICYAGLSDGTCVAWTSAYVVFGLAHMLRAMTATGTSYDADMAQYYLARIYVALNALLTAPPSLGQVQCLIGVAKLIISSPCSYNKAEGHFVSTALRVVRSLAYQDDQFDGAGKPRDAAQEMRVFWIAFINDTSLSILNNTPTTHRLEDVADCSSLVSDGLVTVTAAEGPWRVPIFWLSAKLALLQTEAIDQVLSSKARERTPLDVIAATAMVLARLHDFHEHNIFQLGADQLSHLLYGAELVYTVGLEARYFATIYRLHAFIALERNSRINPFQFDGLRKMSEVKQHKAYADAKRLLSLLPVAPRGNICLYWVIHPVLTAALVTLFAHSTNNPTEVTITPAEMQSYQRTLSDLSAMVKASDNTDLRQNRDLCASLFSSLELALIRQ
ncbi:hypothetical protein BDW02DRAFT_617651 [Decorospora gaudefroyi]|uniref:Transcription factor domain-containing protein n=1 Tax=Decorospora gaudefroyi TaxID=184978 RepID=A0A6A5K1Z1_9PLEO|nr:hypothetical protein BDW02DRAFT_617651 [Decorospora gaudefroyi]